MHNLVLALLFYAFASWSAEHVSKKASTDLALAVAVLFMLLVAYHAEKARTRDPAGDLLVEAGSSPTTGPPDSRGPAVVRVRCDLGSDRS